VATYQLRRFSNPRVLKSITRVKLLKLLTPYSDFFLRQGIRIPRWVTDLTFDYTALAKLFAAPDSDIPEDLMNVLFIIDEMATPTGMDMLLAAACRERMSLHLDEHPTPADLAVDMWLWNKQLLVETHQKRRLRRLRTFECFLARRYPPPEFVMPDDEKLRAMEWELDDNFQRRGRGRGTDINVFTDDQEIWFCIRHGDPYRREGIMDEDERSTIFYRPEKYDLVIYQPKIGELKINARHRWEKDLYRYAFGQYLFGHYDFFPGKNKFTLEPLREHGERVLNCADILGIDWIKLVEIHLRWPKKNVIEIHKADDLFAVYRDKDLPFPSQPQIRRARFQVKYADSSTPRHFIVGLPNTTQYTRDSDAEMVEQWLFRRGFTELEGNHVETEKILAFS